MPKCDIKENSQGDCGCPQGSSCGRDLLLLLLLFGFLYWGLAWIRPLANPDEGRYSEIPREMVVTGNWVTPRLNGVLYFEKPPAMYWAQAVMISIGGIKDWVCRFANCLWAMLGVWGTYYVGLRLYGRRVGLFSAIVLGTSGLYFGMAHVVTLDMMLSVFMALGLYAYLIGRREPIGSSARRAYFWATYALFAVATLTKGFIGLLIPGAILCLWLIVSNRWKDLRHYYIGSGLLIYMIIATPWHVLAAMETPEFFEFYVLNEQFLRYLQPIHGREAPFPLFLVVVLIGGLLPWAVFLVPSLRKACGGSFKKLRTLPDELFLLIWAVFIVFFFSLSKSQLVPYILPAFFPLALIVGRYLADATHGQGPWGFRSGAIAAGVIFLVGGLCAPVAFFFDENWTSLAMLCILWFVLVGLVGGLLILYMLKKGRLLSVIAMIVGTFAFASIAINPLMGALRNSSTKDFALVIRDELGPQDRVFQLFDYYQDFPVYLERLTSVVYIPGEQAFGLSLEDHSDRYRTEEQFIDYWQSSNKRDYAIVWAGAFDSVRSKIGPQRVKVLKENEEFVLFTNVLSGT